VELRPGLTWEDVSVLSGQWPGSFVVKGPLGPDGARAAISAGADGLHLSTHGGRQLDRAVPPVEMLPDVREAVGDAPVIIVDSGIRYGTEVAVAVALGADAAAIGRAYLSGLMAAAKPAWSGLWRCSRPSSGAHCNCSVLRRWPSCAGAAIGCCGAAPSSQRSLLSSAAC
jgi:isopentenyl diphosphate isomerase/L-lactate dehydrogenase-like FMN-dependent dehydrogenase